MKILVVEDEHRISRAIKEGLMDEGYAVDVKYEGAGYNSVTAGNVILPKLCEVLVTSSRMMYVREFTAS